MARTTRGNLTGAAARTERRDFREYLSDVLIRSAFRKEQALRARKDELMYLCLMIEGNEFVEWWDSDSVPANAKTQEYVDLLEERLASYPIPRPIVGRGDVDPNEYNRRLLVSLEMRELA
jgi:hypothetical protein